MYLTCSYNISISSTQSFCFLSFTSPSTSNHYTPSLHDALPICKNPVPSVPSCSFRKNDREQTCSFKFHLILSIFSNVSSLSRSEEHTSELQSRGHLVCRHLLEKKKSSNLNTSQF